MSPLNWKKDISDVPVEALLLLEDCHFGWLDNNFRRQEFAMVLRSKPYLAYFIRHKAPGKAAWVDGLLAEFSQEPLPDSETLRAMEGELVSAMEDWIIYVLEPETYQRQPFLTWDEKELTGMTDWAGKTVVDIGSGTGKQSFAVAPLCKSVYCVEPVYNLRKYLKNRAKREGVRNLYVTDGLMTELPFEDDFADVITSGHVYGDFPQAEVDEMMRVVKPGGMVILIPGNNDHESLSHMYLVDRGFAWARMEFPTEGFKRKYWFVKEA
jgi:SAM-dependent methyltransferase